MHSQPFPRERLDRHCLLSQQDLVGPSKLGAAFLGMCAKRGFLIFCYLRSFASLLAYSICIVSGCLSYLLIWYRQTKTQNDRNRFCQTLSFFSATCIYMYTFSEDLALSLSLSLFLSLSRSSLALSFLSISRSLFHSLLNFATIRSVSSAR